jgi:hypothetical protein
MFIKLNSGIVGFLASLAVLFSHESARAWDGPDPMSLLHGLENSRLEVRSGHLEVSMLSVLSDNPSRGPKTAFDIYFDKEKQFFSQQSEQFTVLRPGSKVKLGSVLNDREGALKSGRAQWTKKRPRSFYDGEKVFTYERS